MKNYYFKRKRWRKFKDPIPIEVRILGFNFRRRPWTFETIVVSSIQSSRIWLWAVAIISKRWPPQLYLIHLVWLQSINCLTITIMAAWHLWRGTTVAARAWTVMGGVERAGAVTKWVPRPQTTLSVTMAWQSNWMSSLKMGRKCYRSSARRSILTRKMQVYSLK